MTFYHGTTEKAWAQIQKEGMLFGKRDAPSRVTYLALTKEEAECYGSVVLEVEYNPYLHKEMNNYSPDCWQVRVYEPIYIETIHKT